MKTPDFEDNVNDLLLVSDYDKVYIKQWHREAIKEEVDRRVQEEVDSIKEQVAIELEQRIRLEVQREETEKNRKQCKVNLNPIRPLLFDNVTYGEKTYDYREFIHPVIKKYSGNVDDGIRKNPHFKEWERTFKNRSPKYLTSSNANLCLIINSSGPGVFEELAVFTDGSDKPHLYPNGNVSTKRINTELQLEDDLPPNEANWVAAAYRLSIRECENVYFYNIPKHPGWHIRPNGELVYVSSLSVLPGLEKLYPTEIKEHRLLPHAQELKEAIKNYRTLLPLSWKAKYMTVERVKSILLPWFKKHGLIDDRVSVIVYRHEEDKRGCIALGKRSNYESTIVKSLTDKDVDIKKELAAANDVTAIFSFSLTIESRRTCCQQFTDILLELKGENGIENPTRKNIILLTETPAKIPEGFPAVYLTIDEDIAWGDINELQRASGALDYSLINFFYKNQYATNSLVEKMLKDLRLRTIEKDIDYPSRSAEMSLATALLLKRCGIVTEEDFNTMLMWITAKSPAVNSSKEALCTELKTICSELLCSGEITTSRQDGRYPCWNTSRIFVGNDGTYNLTPELFQQKIISRMKGTDSYNKACQALETKGLSYPTRTGEHTRTLTVKVEGGGAIKREFISLSPELFSVEARQIVEKTLVSDTFLEYKNCPRQFKPLIKHDKYELVAGQLIGAYSTINPFVLITGSPGLGKSDMLMMQAIIKAESGDTVFIYDQTDAFCKFEWEAHNVPQEVIDKIVFWDLSTIGWPIDLLDFSGCEGHVQKVQRLSSFLKSGSHLTGPNQLSHLQRIVENIIFSYEQGNHDIKDIIDRNLKNTGKEGEVKERLKTIFRTVASNNTLPYTWEELVAMRGKIIVFSRGNAVVDDGANPLDVVLDSFYGFKAKNKGMNVTLILDEVQRMNIVQGSPIDVILSTGRKLNISVYIATQRYVLGRGNLARIEEYCGTKIFLQPMDSCVKNAAITTHLSVDELLSFEQGKCAVVGSIYSEHMGKNVPVRNAIVGMTYRPPRVDSCDKNE